MTTSRSHRSQRPHHSQRPDVDKDPTTDSPEGDFEISPDLDRDGEDVTDAETHASLAAELRDVSVKERGVLVGVQLGSDRSGWSLEASMDELAALAASAGVDVVGRAAQRLQRPVPGTFIGSGKVEEVKRAAADLQAEVILFDHELSPRQQRNLEREIDIKVLDRTAVILDVFSQHARTREGMLQVELAQNEYRLPRLTRLWTHLARQAGGRAGGAGGGVGLRGPGETQIEIDRRLISKRISVLKVQIDKLRTQRRQGRRARQRAGLPVVALVGYTNAGKSTVLNAITGTHVYAADKLFATLDPTTRRIELPSGRQALMTDTVGFIQKLPTQLSAAFRATLEEIEEADLLLHVVDVTHPDALQQAETVEHVLDEMGLADHPMVVAANKIDLLNDVHDDGAPSVAGDSDVSEDEAGVGPDGVADTVSEADLDANANADVGVGVGVDNGSEAEVTATPAGHAPIEPRHDSRMAGHPVLEALRDAYPDLVVVSAVEPYGLDQLLAAIDEELGSLLAEVHLLIPFQDGQVVSRVHEHGMVEQESHSAEGTTLIARVPVTLLGALTSYRIDEPEPEEAEGALVREASGEESDEEAGAQADA